VGSHASNFEYRSDPGSRVVAHCKAQLYALASDRFESLWASQRESSLASWVLCRVVRPLSRGKEPRGPRPKPAHNGGPGDVAVVAETVVPVVAVVIGGVVVGAAAGASRVVAAATLVVVLTTVVAVLVVLVTGALLGGLAIVVGEGGRVLIEGEPGITLVIADCAFAGGAGSAVGTRWTL
jgi:hypothetical protein